MNTTKDIRSIRSVEHAGFYYVVTNDGVFGKGCRRCGGTGHYSFNGFDSICYLCHNIWEARLGDIFEDEAAAKKWCEGKAKAQAARDRKREQEAQALRDARDARVASLTNTNPEVVALLRKVDELESEAYSTGDYSKVRRQGDFLRTMAGKLFNASENGLTPNMVAAVSRIAEKEAQKQAEATATPAPEGRVAVTGEIVSTKVQEGDYGVSYKILVKADEGFKVWVSLPKAQADEAFDSFREEYLAAGYDDYTFGPTVWFEGTAQESQWKGVKGRRITFTATLQPSRDDVSFAFGSRPSKGAWL